MNGTVAGKVSILSPPKHFRPAVLGAEACSGAATTPCSNPVSTVAGSGGAYSLSLAAGTWTLFGYYQIATGGAVFLGTPATVSVKGGATTNLNLTIFYTTPATLKGTVTVTGSSSNDPIKQVSVVACPSAVAYSGGAIPNGCVGGSFQVSPRGSDVGAYFISNLAPGSWTAYPGFCALSGCVVHTGDKQSVTLKAGKTTKLKLTTALLEYGQALVYGTVSVTGAPSGFSATLGADACQVASTCEAVNAKHTGKYAVILTNLVAPLGVWSVKGFYQVPSSSTPVYGPAFPVLAVTGTSIPLNLPVPYQAS